MSSDSIEQALRDLPRVGELIKDRSYRQIWRIEIEGRGYYLKFYPRDSGRLKRIFAGNPALREFARLQLMQKAAIPAPRAVSVLMGFRINERLGDAVLMHAIEPGITLDCYFNNLELQGTSDTQRRQIAAQIIQLVQQLIQAGLGHRDLHLGNFLLSEGKIYLLDAYALRKGGMQASDLLMLGHSVRRYATKTELLRAWLHIGEGPFPRPDNRISRKFWRKELSRIARENAYFGRLRDGDWSGFFFKSRKYPARWSMVSRLRFSESDWRTQWPRLLGQLQSQQFSTVKSLSGIETLTGEIVLAGVPMNVMVQRRRGMRFPGVARRGSQSRRAWHTAWSLIVRDVPTAWPILIMERRKFGCVVDQMIIVEQVAGASLSNIALNEQTRAMRDQLFHRVGQLLRRLETLGFYHRNAQASHFIIQSHTGTAPAPILIDVDDIRKMGGTRSSLHHLLQNLREVQSEYNPADSYALCRGYAPAARMVKEA